jgi:FlgN protein
MTLPNLTESFLRHLGFEETLLGEARANVTELYAALRRGDLNTALNLSMQQEALGAALRDAATARQASVEMIARELGWNADLFTLTALASQLPDSLAAEVTGARERLTALATELADAHARNANLLGHLRSYFRGVLSGLTAPDAPARYGPSGGRLESPTGVAIQAHG